MNGVELRQANVSDEKMLFNLRNHPQVREQSHNTNKILFDKHQKWFKKTILNNSNQILIAEKENMVRFEKINDTYLMSWAISPEFQGCGFGKEIVKYAIQRVEGKIVRAEIKQNNIASIKIAESIGMELTKTVGNTLFYQK